MDGVGIPAAPSAPQSGPHAFDASAALHGRPGLMTAFLLVPCAPYGAVGFADTERRVLTRLKETHQTEESIRENPLWEAYRSFYAEMNVKPSGVSTPLKQALRIMRRDAYRPIHPVVDVCMEIEYSTLCSFQVYDADRIGRSVTYGPADGPGAEDGMRQVRAGELVLSDEHGIIHSPTCGNGAGRLVGDASGSALIRVLRIPGMDADTFSGAVDEAARRLSAADVLVLSADSPTGKCG
ncbi:hypothetical protein [Streptomyces sp. NPDC058989]|uniref:hypothetical protein n=1 Tax=Streptomyces sp. NPDC058989 TaxID=3346686 RepID=UPI0036ADA586